MTSVPVKVFPIEMSLGWIIDRFCQRRMPVLEAFSLVAVYAAQRMPIQVWAASRPSFLHFRQDALER